MVLSTLTFRLQKINGDKIASGTIVNTNLSLYMGNDI